MLDLPSLDNIQTDAELKRCCAAVYESKWTEYLLGDSFHPGGLALTQRLGELLHLQPHHTVLDVAAGKGSSAIYLAQQFGCQVVGVEYSTAAVAEANRTAAAANIAGQVHFESGDAEQLPFVAATFDAVICECAFCTFPDKQTAVSEMAQVLKRDGRLGLSDLTRSGDLPPELNTLLAWIACIADARPLPHYITLLENAGFQVQQTELHNNALSDLIYSVRSKLLALELLVKVKQINFPDANFEPAKAIARSAAETVRQGKLGYALLIGRKTAV